MKTKRFLGAVIIMFMIFAGMSVYAQDNSNTNTNKNTGTGTEKKNTKNTQDVQNKNNMDMNTLDNTGNTQDNTGTGTGTNQNTQDKSKSTRGTGNMGTQSTQGTMNKSEDSEFITEAASSGMMEVELGKLAQQKAQNSRVSAFGAMMVRDHTKANGELKTVALRKNVTIPMELKDKHRSKVDKFQEKSGADFDREYIDMMVDDHQDDIDLFRKESENGKDADVKSFASKTLSVLQMHLDSAKAIQTSLKRSK